MQVFKEAAKTMKGETLFVICGITNEVEQKFAEYMLIKQN